ncbi:uncharacterized protein LOC141623925 isoform X2 [Silene latifolia]|uniref:uncharacterized protein LOC141623925 isoform X2 n=1 Tax=Silene latifolia TaxID=37657 RepID=UPI003D78580B
MMTLIHAKGSFVQWPQSHIHSPDKNYQGEEALAMKSKPQKVSPLIRPNTFLGIKVSREFKQKHRTMDLKLLETEARVLKASGTMINVEIDEHILHNKQICNLSYEELVHLLDEDEIGASHITLFIRYLSELTETMQSTSSYGFLCPHTLSPYSSVEDENYRSDYIARAMTCTGCGRGRKLIFAPYVEGEHWMLGVINPAQSIVYWCDPVGYEEPRQFFVNTISKAFDKRNSIDPLAAYEAKELVWKKIKFMLKAPKTYAFEQIDEVRDIWANFALQFKPKISDDKV